MQGCCSGREDGSPALWQMEARGMEQVEMTETRECRKPLRPEAQVLPAVMIIKLTAFLKSEPIPAKNLVNLTKPISKASHLNYTVSH